MIQKSKKKSDKSKPRKKPSVKLRKKLADKYWSLYIRYRDGELRPDGWYTECITCGEWRTLKTMQCGHFQRRSYNIVRYDEENTNGQCYVCNVMRYGEQYKYALALDLKYGEGTADKLVKMAKEYHKLSVEELDEIIASAKEGIAFYETQGLRNT